MTLSPWLFDRLRRFRAGVEAGISWIKRYFGFYLASPLHFPQCVRNFGENQVWSNEPYFTIKQLQSLS